LLLQPARQPSPSRRSDLTPTVCLSLSLSDSLLSDSKQHRLFSKLSTGIAPGAADRGLVGGRRWAHPDRCPSAALLSLLSLSSLWPVRRSERQFSQLEAARGHRALSQRLLRRGEASLGTMTGGLWRSRGGREGEESVNTSAVPACSGGVDSRASSTTESAASSRLGDLFLSFLSSVTAVSTSPPGSLTHSLTRPLDRLQDRCSDPVAGCCIG
jgi:hypothetical protein